MEIPSKKVNARTKHVLMKNGGKYKENERANMIFDESISRPHLIKQITQFIVNRLTKLFSFYLSARYYHLMKTSFQWLLDD